MKYTVTGKSVEITGGVLTLTAEQAATRKHLLKATGKESQYEIISPVTFKHGEDFGYEGELPKAAGVAKAETKKANANTGETGKAGAGKDDAGGEGADTGAGAGKDDAGGAE